jgi:hypothetical protein
MEPARCETGDPSSSPARDGAKPATAPPDRNSVGSVVPPYWQSHRRNASYISNYSAENGRPTPIGLEDHTDEASDHCKVLWAKGVTIDDYVVISGTAPGFGAYVVFNCTVETLDVSSEPHGDALVCSAMLSQPIICLKLFAKRWFHAEGPWWSCEMLPISRR